MDKKLQEKITEAETLVDQYIDEIGAATANTVLYGIQIAQGLAHDAERVGKWAKEKMAERRKKKELEKRAKLKAALKH